MSRTVAERLAGVVATVLGGPVPVRIRAWDGSEAGPPSGPVLVLRSRRALRRLLWSPGELGVAEAYVAGDLDVDGDLADGLSRVWSAVGRGEVGTPRVRIRDLPGLTATAVRLGVLGWRPPRPGAEARLSGVRHSRERDRAAIKHHYDLSNEFYELLLDDSMAYSCGYFTTGPTGSLADAQRAKLDLICRKLGLVQGRRLLDIGCGWGSLTVHAAAEFGAEVVAVTLSRQQFDHVTKRVADAGLADLVQVQHADYRELASGRHDGAFDAVASIEMGEHVGDDQYPGFVAILRRVLRPGGRVLVQQMSRDDVAPGGGAFIETYIAPDMHMKSLATTIGLLADGGLEVRDVHALREHYAWTVAAWARTLESRWDEAVSLIGEVGARVWRLYLAGGGLAFAEGRMGVDQILAVRPEPDGRSLLEPSRKVWE